LKNPEAKDFIINMDIKLMTIINELRKWAGKELSDEFDSI